MSYGYFYLSQFIDEAALKLLNKMLNYFAITTLAVLILIAQNVILLNEETLILVCFITFSWLAVKNLSGSVAKDLDIRSATIENDLKKSLKYVSNTLSNTLGIKDRFWNVFNEFKSLGNNCLNIVNVMTMWSVKSSIENAKVPFPKRLQFISRLESQTAQLLSLLVAHKLQKVTNLKHFCHVHLNNPHFACLGKISTREYINSIIKS